MKHILKGLILFLSLIFLAACESPISEGTIVNKHMTEAHTETSVIWVEDMPIFSEDEIPDKYYFDVTGKDKDGRGHTVTVQNGQLFEVVELSKDDKLFGRYDLDARQSGTIVKAYTAYEDAIDALQTRIQPEHQKLDVLLQDDLLGLEVDDTPTL